MKILLVNTNREKLPQPVIPIGMCRVASALARIGHNVKTVDLCFASQPLSTLATSVATFAPDCIGLSIRNIDNSQYQSPRFYLPEVRGIVEALKRLTDVPIVIGGSAVGVAPWALLDYLGGPYAVAGDGEEAMGELVAALERGTVGQLAEAVFRSDGKMVLRKNVHSSDVLDGPADAQCWLDLAPYRRYNVPLPVQSKRGCVFDCSYCTYRDIEGDGYRLRTPGPVAEEIAAVAHDTGYRRFEFVDSTFNHPESQAIEVCEALIRLGYPVVLQASVNPASHSPELFSTMRRAGFSNLVCTPDSASDEVLRRMGKGFSTTELSAMVEAVHAVDLPVLWCFLFGGPGETESTVGETLRFIEERLTGRDVVFLAAGVRIYPGTRLADEARREGMIEPDDELLRPTFYFSPALSPERFARLVGEHLSRRKSYMIAGDLGRGWLLGLQRVAAWLHWKTPLWQQASLFNRLAPRRWVTGGSKMSGANRAG